MEVLYNLPNTPLVMKHASYLLIVIAFACASCHTTTKFGTNTAYKLEDEHTAPASKVWRGTYTGTVVTQECGATDMTVTLLQDMDYTLTRKCAREEPMKQTGKYLVDPSGKTLILTTGNGGEIARFIMVNNTLAQVDHHGNKMQSSVADQYVLRK